MLGARTTVTPFPHQPEAQHPKSFSYPQLAGRLPHLSELSRHQTGFMSTHPSSKLFTCTTGRSDRMEFLEYGLSRRCEKPAIPFNPNVTTEHTLVSPLGW